MLCDKLGFECSISYITKVCPHSSHVFRSQCLNHTGHRCLVQMPILRLKHSQIPAFERDFLHIYIFEELSQY